MNVFHCDIIDIGRRFRGIVITTLVTGYFCMLHLIKKSSSSISASKKFWTREISITSEISIFKYFSYFVNKADLRGGNLLQKHQS